MPRCGSQVILCGLPIRFDTYTGCSHLCKYCFAQKKVDLQNIRVSERAGTLEAFIRGERTQETIWCDWDIPIHWGGLSDPFQPLEEKYKESLRCLEVFAKTGYPFVVSTKGRLITSPEYLSLIKDCNCVVQISMVSPQYDVLEKGAPTYAERLQMVETLAHTGKRVNIRIQPYMTEVHDDVVKSMQAYRDAGAYGVIVEGMKFFKRKPGLVKVGGDYCYPKDILQRRFAEVKEEAHQSKLRFYCGENRLRSMGDSLTCCGIDGLGWMENAYNLCHLLNGANAESTERMREPGTARCFKALEQTSASSKNIKGKTFAEYMAEYYMAKTDYIHSLFGK